MAEMSSSLEEQLGAARAQIAQLQAADLPSALQGLLHQASTQLKPPRAGAPAATAAAAAAAASRPALVLGLLLVLERASTLAQQQRDLKLLKDAHSQLAAAFQKDDWLWQLLLRKHLPDVLQHPAAAQRLLGALAALPACTQARAYRLWFQQLVAQPGALAVPLSLQLALLEQLRQCFAVRSLDLGLPGASEPLGQPTQQGSAATGAAAAAGAAAGSEALSAAEVHVALREQLPPLLQLLLLVACSGVEAAASAGAEGGQPGEGGSSGRGSANAPPAPSLSTVQSAVAARRDPRRRGGSSVVSSQAAQPASALAASSEPGAPNSSSRGSILDSVLRHAVLLISRLSEPDALHEMLGIQLRRAAQGPAHGSGSDDEEGDEAETHQERRREAAAAVREQLLSRRDAERISTAAALIEVCLDGMLSLPPLAAAVHQQLHSKGNSNAAAVAGEAADGAVAEAVQQQQDAAAELRTTAGLMLGMHRELLRMLAEHQQQLQGGTLTLAATAKLRQPAPLLSLPACQQLLCVLADVHVGAGGTAGGPSTSGQQQGAGAAGPQFWAAAERAPAVLLVPPQLAVQGIELVRRAVEAGGPSFQPTAAAAEVPSWRAAMAAQVAAIYSACYQAIWGAKVLQSAEAYQLLLSAARLRRLLRPADGAAAAPAAADDEAAAEAALLAENAVGNRRRRQRSAAHELPSLGAAPKGKAVLPAAKRIKTEHGGRPSSTGGDGSAVAELLQLFSSPAAKPPASGSKQDQPQQTAGRKRITPVAVSQQQGQESAQPESQQAAAQPQSSSQQQDKPARKRIVPQQIGPASSSKPAPAGPEPSQHGSGASAAAANAEQPGEDGMADGEAVLPGWQQGQRRMIISKAADMTEEQQEEMWAAYIADKEFLAEMLGDADYQRWFDEAAHPLRKQRQRPGGLEAAWAAVLGGRSAGSIVQQQLPRTLLDASVTMRWDAAAAACLGLLAALLRGVAATASLGSSAAVEGGTAQDERGLSELERLLQGTFSRQQLEVGARAATRILGISGATSITGTIQAAQRSPAGGSLVLLAAQMLGLAQGQNYFQQQAVSGLSYQGVPAEQQRAADSGGVVAPPLLEAYAQLLAVLLPHAQQEAAASSAAMPGAAHLTPLAKTCHPLSVTAQMAEHLLRLPPPLQHMLAPGCAALLRVAAAGRSSDAQQAAQQHAAVLWMLVQPRQACTAGTGSGVELPADCPAWLQEEALLLERSCPNFHQHRSDGHAMLLGPAPEVQRAAALELLQQLRLQLDLLRQHGGSLPADVLLVAADACHAAMQRLLLESQVQQRRQLAEEEGSDAETDGDEEQQGELLLLGGPAAADVAALAAALCDVGAAAAASAAAALDAAAAHSDQAPQQQRKRRAQQSQQTQQQQPDSQACAAVAEAASVLVLCNQLLEPADQLLQSGCLPPAAQQQLEAACELLDGQGQSVGQLSDGLPSRHPLTAAIETAMAEAPALWQPAAEEEGEQAGSEAEASSGSDGDAGPARPASQQRKKVGSNTSSSGKAGDGKGQAAAKPKRRSERGRRRKMGEVRNPAVRAMLAEDGGAGLDDDDLSDLEDFLVFNPERDYGAFFKRHFWQARGSDSEEEEEEEAGEAEAAQGKDGPAAEEQEGTGGGVEIGKGAGRQDDPQRQADACQRPKQQQQRQRQRQRPPAKPRDRGQAAAKNQQQQAAVHEQQPVLGSVAAAAAAAGAAAAAKRQGSGSKAQPKRKR